MKPKYQRTVAVTIRDRESGWVMITSILVTRRKVVISAPLDDLMCSTHGAAPFERIEARLLRLGELLRQRWFGVAA